jgi:hypothetical protein
LSQSPELEQVDEPITIFQPFSEPFIDPLFQYHLIQESSDYPCYDSTPDDTSLDEPIYDDDLIEDGLTIYSVDQPDYIHEDFLVCVDNEPQSVHDHVEEVVILPKVPFR